MNIAKTLFCQYQRVSSADFQSFHAKSYANRLQVKKLRKSVTMLIRANTSHASLLVDQATVAIDALER